MQILKNTDSCKMQLFLMSVIKHEIKRTVLYNPQLSQFWSSHYWQDDNKSCLGTKLETVFKLLHLEILTERQCKRLNVKRNVTENYKIHPELYDIRHCPMWGIFLFTYSESWVYSHLQVKCCHYTEWYFYFYCLCC